MALDNKNKNEYDQAHHVLGPKSKPGQVKCKMDKSNFEFSFNQNLMVNKEEKECIMLVCYFTITRVMIIVSVYYLCKSDLGLQSNTAKAFIVRQINGRGEFRRPAIRQMQFGDLIPDPTANQRRQGF